MKRNGFTLAELLIVLGITGVIAAVILPAINGLMPDKTKIMYLKVYDELGKNIKALSADTSIFPIILKNGNDDIDVSTIPLLNNEQPLKSPFKDDNKFTGDKKLCNLIAFSMGVNDACRDTTYPETPSFTTANGMKWWISETKRDINPAESKASYQTDIYVDVDSSKKSSDCMYGEENCKNPDRFKFLLAADGSLIPADPAGLHYINTRKNLLKKNFKPEGDVLVNLDDTLLNRNYHLYLDDNDITPTPPPGTEPGETPETPGIKLPADSKNCSSDPYSCRCGDIFRGRIINCYSTNHQVPSVYNYEPTDIEKKQDMEEYASKWGIIYHKINASPHSFYIAYHKPVGVTFQFPLKRNLYIPSFAFASYEYELLSTGLRYNRDCSQYLYPEMKRKLDSWLNSSESIKNTYKNVPMMYVLPAGRTYYKAPNVLPKAIANFKTEDLQEAAEPYSDQRCSYRFELFHPAYYAALIESYEDDFESEFFGTFSQSLLAVDNDYIYFYTGNTSNGTVRLITDDNIDSTITTDIKFGLQRLESYANFGRLLLSGEEKSVAQIKRVAREYIENHKAEFLEYQ